MPPLSTPSSQASGRSWLTNSSEHKYLLEGIILCSVFVTACWSIVILIARRKSGMSRSSPNRSDMPSNEDEKKSISHQRKDSYQDDLSNSSTIKQEDTDITKTWPPMKQEQHQYGHATNPPFPIHPNTYLDSLRQETLQPAFIPIYPWISAPKPLPGPYDPPYYLLPLPTLQPETQFQTTTAKIQPPVIKTEDKNEEQELETASYARHISPHSTQDSEAVLEGAVITLSKGWRRTQWTVIAG